MKLRSVLAVGIMFLASACSEVTITSSPSATTTPEPAATLEPSRTTTPDIPATQDAERFRLTIQAYQTEVAAEKATERANTGEADESAPLNLTLAGSLDLGVIYGAAFSQEGAFVVLLTDGQTQIVSTSEGKIAAVFDGEAFNNISFSPVATTLAAGFLDGRLLLLPENSPAPIELAADFNSGLAFTADGQFVVAGTAAGIGIWNAGTSDPFSLLETQQAFGVNSSRLEINFSANGVRAAVFFENGSAVWIGTTASLLAGNPQGILVPWLDHAGPVASVFIDPDWRTLAWVSRGTLQLMTAAGEPIGEPIQHQDWILNLAFVPGQDLLLITTLQTSGQTASGLLRGYALDDGSVVLDLPTQATITALAVHPEGGSAVTGHSDGSVRLWDLTTGTAIELTGHDSPIQQVIYSPDGSLLATIDGNTVARVWDAPSGEGLATLEMPEGVSHWIGFNRDGTGLVVISDSGVLRFYRIDR